MGRRPSAAEIRRSRARTRRPITSGQSRPGRTRSPSGPAVARRWQLLAGAGDHRPDRRHRGMDHGRGPGPPPDDAERSRHRHRRSECQRRRQRTVRCPEPRRARSRGLPADLAERHGTRRPERDRRRRPDRRRRLEHDHDHLSDGYLEDAGGPRLRVRQRSCPGRRHEHRGLPGQRRPGPGAPRRSASPAGRSSPRPSRSAR